MTDHVDRLLTEPPDPAPPPTLAPAVMARIAREPQPAAPRSLVRARTGRELAGWVWATVGLLVVVGVTLYGWTDTGTIGAISSPHIGGLARTLATGVVLTIGLWLFLISLFAPLQRKM